MAVIHKSTISILFINCFLLAAITDRVEGHCERRTIEQMDGNEPDHEHSKVSKVLLTVGCGIKTGVKVVSDTVKDGYRYLKEKISSVTSAHKQLNPEEENIETYPQIDVRLGRD